MLKVPSADSTRHLAVESWGSQRDDAVSVFLLHGTPGSRIGPRPRGIVLHRLGVRLISYDRPGYGESDRQPQRSVRDAAADIRAIADHLGLDKFSIVGRSGGGPHALAAAAVLGDDRVERVAALVSLAPPEADQLAWYEGMGEYNVRGYHEADAGLAAIRARLLQRVSKIQEDPANLLAALETDLSDADRRVVDDVVMRKLLLATYTEGVRQNADGWIDDALALRRPWGFDPAEVEVPTLLWHGEVDRFSPLRHTQWLADRIPGSKVLIEPGAAHFGAMEVLPRVLGWITSPLGTAGFFESAVR